MSAATPLELRSIPVDLIDPSTNYRRTYAPDKLEQLAASLVSNGQLQPVLVRPKADRYELVFGERRRRAAMLAGLHSLLANIREMSDSEMLETQIIENAQREDVHPLEEADGYLQLHEKYGHHVDDIAAKVGKSKAQVYARLKLCSLCPEARKAFLEDKLTPSTALYVARIPSADLQKQATKEIVKGAYGDSAEPMSARKAAEHIQHKYMLRLVDAPFDRADAALVPKAGPCTTCPKRTGNQAELFDDVKSGDVCTDTVCFEKKKDAAWEVTKAKAAEEGTKVVAEKEVKKLFPYGDERVSYNSEVVDIEKPCPADPKGRTWKQLLGKEAPKPMIARDPLGGVHKLVDVDVAKKALKSAHPELTKTTGSTPKVDAKAKEKAKAERELEELTDSMVVTAVVESTLARKNDALLTWRAVISHIIAVSCGAYDEVAMRRDLVTEKTTSQAEDLLVKAANTMNLGQLQGLALELLLEDAGSSDWEIAKEVLRACHVDRKSIEAKARKQLAEKAKAPAAMAADAAPKKKTEKPAKPAAAKKTKKKGGAK